MVIVLLLNSIKIIRIYSFLDRFILRTYRKVRNKLLPFLSALVSRNKTKTFVRFWFNFSVQLYIPTWVLVVKEKPKVVQSSPTVSQFRKFDMPLEHTQKNEGLMSFDHRELNFNAAWLVFTEEKTSRGQYSDI